MNDENRLSSSMTNLPHSKISARVKRFSLIIMVIWTVLIGVILLGGILWARHNTVEHAVLIGQDQFAREKEILTWLASHDNPKELYRKTIATSSASPGNKVEKFSQAVTSHPNQGHSGYITSQFMGNFTSSQNNFFLTGFEDRLLNTPDKKWLRRAYDSFSADSTTNEYFERVKHDGTLYLNMVKPLYAGKSCMSCHAKAGLEEGDLLGGMGISIPLEQLYEHEKNETLSWTISLVGLWLIGLFGIWYSNKRTIARLSQLNKLAGKLTEQEKISAERENLFELLFSSISDVVVIIGTDRTILAVNDAFVGLSGYTEEEVLGKKTEFFFADKNSYREIAFWLQENAPDFIHTNVYETVYRMKDGTNIPCETFMSTIFNTRSEHIGYVSIVRDISARKQADQEEKIKLFCKEIMLKLEGIRDLPLEDICMTGLGDCTTLFESEFGIMFFCDNKVINKRVLSWSEAEKISEDCAFCTSIPCEEHANLSFLSQINMPLIHNDFSEAEQFQFKSSGLKKTIKRCLIVPIKEQEDIVFTLVIANKKDPYTPNELKHAESLMSHLKKIILWRHGQAEKQQLEHQVQEMQKMKAVGTLAGGIAHDLNNILGIIFCNVGMALEDAKEDESVSPHILRINEAANRGKEMVEQLLTFTRRNNQGFIPMKPAPLMNECLSLLRSTIPSSIKLTQNISRGAGTILGNPTQFEQVLINLFYNAVHSLTDESGAIHVTGELVTLQAEDIIPHGHDMLASGQYFKMGVCDTGIGIPHEDWEKVYEPFYTTKGEGRGTGLGLSVAMSIVSNHGGSIQFESEPGRGTSFHVFFPILENEDTRAQDKIINTKPRAGNESILLVDDEVLFTQVTEEMLERLGYDVTVRSNGEEGLSLFQKNPDRFDLVITDQIMPIMNGMEMAEKMLAVKPELPIILCTGYKKDISNEQVGRIGIRAICKKPFNRDQLLAVVGDVLDSERNVFFLMEK